MEPLNSYYHFSTDGRHYWEYPFLEQRQRVWGFNYHMTEHGVFIAGVKSGRGWELGLALDGEYLVITGPHGMRSWVQRIAPAERPEFLTLFFAPPSAP